MSGQITVACPALSVVLAEARKAMRANVPRAQVITHLLDTLEAQMARQMQGMDALLVQEATSAALRDLAGQALAQLLTYK